MKRTGKNQKEFADELCVAPATLSGIFKGTTKPSTNIVASIHERFPEISVPWLMFGEGDMYVSAVDTVPADSSVPAGSSAPADMQGATVVQQDLFAVPPTQAESSSPDCPSPFFSLPPVCRLRGRKVFLVLWAKIVFLWQIHVEIHIFFITLPIHTRQTYIYI